MVNVKALHFLIVMTIIVTMKLFSLFSSHFYKPSWIYKAGSQLWRILFSHGHLLAGEHRDNDAKKVTFFCVDSRSGQEQWNMSRKDEGWWTTTEGVYGKNLYLHAFAKPDLPHPKHVTAIDMETGRVLWEHPEYTFLYVTGDAVVVEKRDLEQTRCHRLDPRSGEIYDTIDDYAIVEAERYEARSQDPHLHLTFPNIYNPEMNDHSNFITLINKIQQKERLVDPIEVLQYENNLLICYHKVKGGEVNGNTNFTHELVIFDKNKHNELYRDTLYDNASAPVPDGFFIRENVLYYIRKKSELVAVTLQDVP